MLERENMEEGLMSQPLLEEDKITKVGGGANNGTPSPTPVVIFSAIVVTCGAFAYGCCYGFSSPAESGIQEELGLSTSEYSVFGSILTIGGMLGAIISGKVADLIGRRGTMWVFQGFCIAGWLAIVFAKVAWWLDFGRLSLGIGFGIYCYLAPIYLAEITPKEIRGAFIAAMQLMACCGCAVMFFLGNFIHWRTLALIDLKMLSCKSGVVLFGAGVLKPVLTHLSSLLKESGNRDLLPVQGGTLVFWWIGVPIAYKHVGTIPCLLQVVGIFFIPESPRWLAKIGREKEVEATLRCLRGKHADISQEAAEIKNYTESLKSLSNSRFLDLFQRKYTNSLIVGVGLMLLVQFGGTNGISYYASSIFEVAGGSVSIGTTAMAVIQLPFSALSILLMDKFGRRPLLMVSAAGASFGSSLIGMAFLLQDLHQQQKLTAILVLSGILVYSASYSMGLSSVPFVIMSEIFPINIKGQAGSLLILANWFSSWVVSYTFNFLYEWSPAGVFLIFATICLSIVMFTLKMVPETKGRTLEEIQASIT